MTDAVTAFAINYYLENVILWSRECNDMRFCSFNETCDIACIKWINESNNGRRFMIFNEYCRWAFLEMSVKINNNNDNNEESLFEVRFLVRGMRIKDKQKLQNYFSPSTIRKLLFLVENYWKKCHQDPGTCWAAQTWNLQNKLYSTWLR